MATASGDNDPTRGRTQTNTRPNDKQGILKRLAAIREANFQSAQQYKKKNMIGSKERERKPRKVKRLPK
jgi:hypothetical protein